MKKYLMTGIAAMMFCGVFTSCSRDTDFGGSTQQQIMETYEQAFQSRFGTPAVNQDWGFGSSRANTRATGDFANYHGAEPNGHLWTSFGFHAPDELTPGQKLRVQFYFQMVKNPGNAEDQGVMDFFMQQVYDGATDPITNYGYTSPTYSKEVYPAANGTTEIESGKHMDHLTAGDDNSSYHIYNFNNANYPNPIPNVANWDQTTLDDPTQEHSDQIMLMLNTPTKHFGYANSDASYVRTDRWRLVSGEVIDNYCDNVNNSGWTAFLAAHEGVEDKQCYWDDWHRSYIGFDFDMIPDSTIFDGQYVDKDGAPVYDLVNQKDRIHHIEYTYYSKWLGTNTQVWNGTAFVDASNYGDLVGDENSGYRFYPYMPGTTKRVHVLNCKTNEYCGTSETVQDDFWEYEYRENGDYKGKFYRVDNMISYLTAGKLPISGDEQPKTWILVNSRPDGYYSDWIVSFMPADGGDVPPGPTPTTVIEKLRVIAEDLTVSQNTDFDFNDVVFDVIWTKVYSDETLATLSSQTVQITLQAAGGTLPLYVDGKEVHHEFDVDLHTMVNTNAKHLGMNGKDDATPVTWTTTNYSGTTIGEIANSIDVYVIKNGETCHLSAPVGGIASKIGVKFINDQGYQWCDEREDIDHRYSLSDGTPLFSNWVQGIYPADDWYDYAYDEIVKYRAALSAANNSTNP